MRLTIVYVCAKFHENRFNSKQVMTDPIRVGGTSAGVAIIPGLGGQTVVGGKAFENDWFFFKWYIKNFHFLGYADSIWLFLYVDIPCLQGKIWKFSSDSD